MEALILSCGTGGGHNSAGIAIKEEMERRGHHVTMMNPYEIAGEKTSRVIDETYIKVAQKSPKLFGAVYRAGDLYRKLPWKSPVYHANLMMLRKVRDYLNHQQFDLVVMPHLFPAEILTGMKKHGYDVPPMVFIATDYTCIPFTEETDCDAYIIPSEDLKQEFMMCGIPEDKIKALGIPVRKAYSDMGKETRGQCRKTHGLKFASEDHVRYILISGGSMGAGNLITVLQTLLWKYRKDPEVRIVVICGNNEALYEKLKAKYDRKAIIISHTDQMPLYMKACSLFISKPGGLSSTEAAAAGVPLIHISPIPGCETKNQEYFRKRKMAIPAVHLRRDIPRLADALMDETNAKRMRAYQGRYINSDAASDICDYLESRLRTMNVL